MQPALPRRPLLAVGEPQIYVPWYQLAKGMAEYRAGRYDEATKYLEQSRPSLPAASQATADLLLAMAHRKAGREDSARAAAERSRERIPPGLVTPPPLSPEGEAQAGPVELDSSFENWLIYWIVRREAEATLGPLMPKPPPATSRPAAGG